MNGNSSFYDEQKKSHNKGTIRVRLMFMLMLQQLILEQPNAKISEKTQSRKVFKFSLIYATPTDFAFS